MSASVHVVMICSQAVRSMTAGNLQVWYRNLSQADPYRFPTHPSPLTLR